MPGEAERRPILPPVAKRRGEGWEAEKAPTHCTPGPLGLIEGRWAPPPDMPDA